MKKNRKAFTLAEVLITLTILGVVAALVIPAITKFHTRITTQTKIAKFFATVDNALKTAEAHEGKGFASFDITTENAFYDKYFAPYLNISKNCRTTTCPYPMYYQTGVSAGNFSPRYCLKDGACFQMMALNLHSSYGDILWQFDINGEKGPNRFGKDIFWLNVFKDENGSYYVGTPGFDYNGHEQNNLDGAIRLCKTELSSGHGGRYCTAWIVKNGFKIPKDYPWL